MKSIISKIKKENQLDPISYFDASYYLSMYEDIKKIGVDPYEHYMKLGFKEGRNPNRWFETDYYLKANADVKAHGGNPFLHYLNFGWVEERLPNSYSTEDFYGAIDSIDDIANYFTLEKIVELQKTEQDKYLNQVILGSNAFDVDYYLGKLPEYEVVEEEKALGHYLEKGWIKQYAPNRWFQADYYLKTNADVKALDGNPFLHYLNFGWKEGRLPNSFSNPSLYEEIYSLDDIADYYTAERVSYLKRTEEYEQMARVITDAQAFDVDYYLDHLPEGEVIEEEEALNHYLKKGWIKQYAPNDWFNCAEYLKLNPDVARMSVEPLSHYLAYGQNEQRWLTIDEGSLPFFPVDQLALDNIEKLKNPEAENRYVDYVENEKFNTTIKTIVFYLPQFHPFPENDEWWGKGFTEWTNVTKAKPNYVGHYQPHLPIHNAFYDLRVEEVMVEQAKLAKNYGIYGFNYYYYWFDGKILMDLPLKNMLKNKKIDIPFCLTWANENWTRRWDGLENDVLIAQNHSEKDSIAFIRNLFEYFNDERYITINDKPVLIIYRANIIPEIKDMAKIWREEVKKAGFKGLYLVSAQTFGVTTPDEFGFDASMEFPPHSVKANEITDQLEIINSEYEGNVFNYETVVKTAISNPEPTYDLYRTSMLGWDNTARKQNAAHTFSNFTTYKFKQWFSHIVNDVYNNDKYSHKLVFVNAWNEWAEGTHLEPDREFGYASLNAVHEVLSQYEAEVTEKMYPAKAVSKKNNVAVILHLHYLDMWEEIAGYLSNFGEYGFDLYISVTETSNQIVDKILKKYPSATIFLFENRGRDIYPFIRILKKIIDLDYTAVCKIHSKKSLYREDGSKIKDDLFGALLGNNEKVDEIIALFDTDKKLGLVVPEKYNIPHTRKNMKYHKKLVVALDKLLQVEFEESFFPAGSMYWFKPEALKELCLVESKHIPLEDGWSDGTIMHTIERYIGVLVKNNDYKVILSQVRDFG